MEDIMGTVISLRAVKVTPEEDPVGDLTHGVGGVGLASYF
jgi:outer membrane lipoprotein SlyB